MLAAGQAGGNIPIPWEVQRDFLLQGQHTALTLTSVLAWWWPDAMPGGMLVGSCSPKPFLSPLHQAQAVPCSWRLHLELKGLFGQHALFSALYSLVWWGKAPAELNLPCLGTEQLVWDSVEPFPHGFPQDWRPWERQSPGMQRETEPLTSKQSGFEMVCGYTGLQWGEEGALSEI